MRSARPASGPAAAGRGRDRRAQRAAPGLAVGARRARHHARRPRRASTPASRAAATCRRWCAASTGRARRARGPRRDRRAGRGLVRRRHPAGRAAAGERARRPIAYKTGTSYGYRDAWAVGFDRRTTIGVWVGRPDGAAVPGLVGRLVAAPILFDAYRAARRRARADPDAGACARRHHRHPAAAAPACAPGRAEDHRLDGQRAAQDRLPARTARGSNSG